MTKRARRRTEPRRARMAPPSAQEYRYYVHVVDEWGLDKPLSVFRVWGEVGAVGEEEIAPGAVWKPTTNAWDRANRTTRYSAVPVDADTANRLAASWAYTYHRIVELPSVHTVAYARTWTLPGRGTHRFEESTCHSGVWESTRRLWRVDAGLDDYAVGTVEAAVVEDYLRGLTQSEYRYFAVVKRGGTDFALNDPAEVLRVRAGRRNGILKRLQTAWEPNMLNIVRGLRDESLLEIDDFAADQFRWRRSEPPGSADGAHRRRVPLESQYTYYALVRGGLESVDKAQEVVRQWRTGPDVHEEMLSGGPRWVRSKISGRETRKTDPHAVEVSLETVEKLKAPWRYAYYEILPPDSDQPMAVVRHHGAYGGREEAAVGWPSWYPSKWLEQIAQGKIPYRAREADVDAVQRYLSRAAGERPKYRYFAFLDGDDSIDSARRMARMHGGEYGILGTEETPRPDGSWVQTFEMLDIDHGKGNWHLDPVEVPAWLFERYRAKRQGNTLA